MSDSPLTVSLKSLATITMGQSPDSSCVNSSERGLPFLQGCAEFGPYRPSAKVFCSPPLRTAREGSTLISVRAPVGRMNRADQDYCIGRGLGAFLAIPDVADDVFLKHAVEQNISYLDRRSQGSTFLAIGANDLQTIPLPEFDLPEQQRIAEILSAVDEAIEQTEALIAKTQQIKSGLMHDLFTRGVTPDGQLRPPRQEAPLLYKDSPLGWIPKEWELDRLSNLGDFMNGLNLPKDQFGFGVKFVNILDVYLEHLDLDSLGLMNASRSECVRYGLVLHDILIDRSSVKLEGVGYPTIFPDTDEEVVFCGFIIRFRLTTGRLSGPFVLAAMRSAAFRRMIMQIATVSANVNVNQQALGGLPMVVPTPDEQTHIVERLAQATRAIQQEEVNETKLRQLKRGLMADLLSGQVRVSNGSSGVENGKVVNG